MSTYRKLPALLRRINALESGRPLCRTWNCYREVGLFAPPPFCAFCRSSLAMGFEFRLGYGVGLAGPSSLSPFIHIDSAC